MQIELDAGERKVVEVRFPIARLARWDVAAHGWAPVGALHIHLTLAPGETIEVEVLGPKQRAALVLRVYEDMTHQEIASTLGTSVGAAKAPVTKCRPLKRCTKRSPATPVP